MFKGIITTVAVFFITSASFGGESWHKKEFEVKEKPNVISRWLKENTREVVRSTGGEIISKDGDNIRLRQDTQKGIMEFTIRESSSDSGDTYNYSSKLIKVHSGLIEDQKTVIKVESYRGGSKITIELSASVSNTKPIAIKPELTKSVKGFQQMVERQFR